MTGTWPVVRAPGKVMLAGEYGVLAGGEALVMAVDRYVTVGVGNGAATDNPLVQAVRAAASERLKAPLPEVPPPTLMQGFVDDAGFKLGLGSSAALATALAGSAWASTGAGLDDPEVRGAVLECALAGHRAAGGGSGADVVASAVGGVVRVRFDEDQLTSGRVELTEATTPLVVRGGAGASTRDILASLEALADDTDGLELEPGLLRPARMAGDALVRALATGQDVVEAVNGVRLTLTVLLEMAGFTAGLDALARAQGIAERFGGAAKPSGASPADLILVFAPDLGEKERTGLHSALETEGLPPLPLALDREGVRLATTSDTP